uniref:Transposase n=1 Tax=Steinernema glaseri TaxID=37863 RepID=A0A1I7XYH8_9BILA
MVKSKNVYWCTLFAQKEPLTSLKETAPQSGDFLGMPNWSSFQCLSSIYPLNLRLTIRGIPILRDLTWHDAIDTKNYQGENLRNNTFQAILARRKPRGILVYIFAFAFPIRAPAIAGGSLHGSNLSKSTQTMRLI